MLGGGHEVIVGVDDVLVERHLADIHFVLQVTIQVSGFLNVFRHMLACILSVLRITEETTPESTDILRLQGKYHCLLLEGRIVAVVVGEVVDEEDFNESLVAGELVDWRHEVHDGRELLVLLDQFWILHHRLILLRPFAIVLRLRQDVDVLLCYDIFAVHE